jgi:integrase/recombinase XerC
MLENFVQYLQYEKRYSSHTVDAYRADILQLTDYLFIDHGMDHPDEAESVQIRSWVASLMDAGIQARSINRKLSSIKAYYKWQMKYHGRRSNPAKDIAIARVGKRLPNYVEEEQMLSLAPAEIFPETYEGYRDHAMLELFYHTGMRSAELIGLLNSSIDYEQSTIRILGKRNKERIVPVSQAMLELLERYKIERDALAIIKNPASFFLTENGVKLYPKLVYRVVNHYLRRVSSLQKKSPHVLRHTFATHMLNHGANLNAIKELLGHASLAATQVYTHNSIEQLKLIHSKAHPKG